MRVLNVCGVVPRPPGLAPEPEDPEAGEPIPEEWQYTPPPYWFDAGTGSVVHLSSRVLAIARTQDHHALLDLEENGYDPRFVSGLKMTSVSLADVQLVARDETLGHVEIQFLDGAQTRRLRVRHSTEDTGEMLLDFLQGALGERWQRRVAPRPRTRAVSGILLYFLVIAVPWTLWYLKASTDERELIRSIADSNGVPPELVGDIVAAPWAYWSTTRLVVGTGIGFLFLFLAAGVYKLCHASTEAFELARTGRPARGVTAGRPPPRP